MAFPIQTYADIYDQTYSRREMSAQERADFGHLIIRDSNTVGKHYLLLGCIYREDSSLDVSIRLHRKQAKQIIRAINKWLERINGLNPNPETRDPKEVPHA